MNGLQATLSRILVEEPSWLFLPHPDDGVDLDEGATFLSQLGDEDFGIFVLAYGFGMRLGSVSQSLRMEPALVIWRIRHAFANWERDREAAESSGLPALELAIARLLRGEVPDGESPPPPPRGRPSWKALDLVSDLDAAVQARLHARLRLAEEMPADVAHPGVGIGSVVLILLVVTGFLVFGVIRDVNPVSRGKTHMRKGEYRMARDAFLKLGDNPEAHKLIAFCHLAEGEYDKAFDYLARPDVIPQLGAFGPKPHKLAAEDVDPQSHALLPRGLVMTPRPDFVYAAGPRGEVTVTAGGQERWAARRLADTRHGPAYVDLPYPDDWNPLDGGLVIWSVPDAKGAPSQAAFTVLEREEQKQIYEHFWRFLTDYIPPATKDFLRGHYLLNRGLYTRAGVQFGQLALQFPDEEYPRRILDRIAKALGVDPMVFLR